MNYHKHLCRVQQTLNRALHIEGYSHVQTTVKLHTPIAMLLAGNDRRGIVVP
jgi:hypothetical protein